MCCLVMLPACLQYAAMPLEELAQLVKKEVAAVTNTKLGPKVGRQPQRAARHLAPRHGLYDWFAASLLLLLLALLRWVAGWV